MPQFDYPNWLTTETPGVPITDAQIETLAALIAERLSAHAAPHLIDAAEAGRLLGVPTSWVLTEARANRVPHVRLGKYVRFEPNALTAWWGDNQRTS